MNDNKDLFPLVESYLSGSLSGEELNAFEQKLATDATLQQQVELSRLAQAALKRRKLYDIKNLSESVHQEEKQSAKTKQIAVGVAALALLLAGGAYVLLSGEKDVTQLQPTVVPKSQTEEAIVLPKENTAARIEPKTVTEKAVPVSKPNQQEKVVSTIPPPERSTLPVSVYESKELPAQSITTAAPASPAAEATVKVTEAKPLPDPCATAALEAFVMTEPACTNEQNGRITVSGFKGGQAPYRSKILDESAQEVSSSRLGAGTYTALVIDHHNCSKKLGGIVVKETECKKDFELNAGNGEIVELETAAKSGNLTIYDKGGNLYFHKEFSQGEKIHWNGASSHGEQLTGTFCSNSTIQMGKCAEEA